MEQTYWVEPRDSAKFFMSILTLLAGNARVALEGERDNLLTLDLGSIARLLEEPLTPFTREWDEESTFLVLPLEPNTLDLIAEKLVTHDQFISCVGAIQIEKNGEIQFLAGDNFHHECISVGPAVPEHFLQTLVATQVIREYHRPKAQP